MTFSPPGTQNPYLQTSIYLPEAYDSTRGKLIDIFRNIAYNVNVRQIGIFSQGESLCGQQWDSTTTTQKSRDTFRMMYFIGPIATGATSTTAHNIVGLSQFTHIYGTCVTDVIDYRPIPYASTVAVNQQISLTITPTNIVIVNGAASPNITKAIVVLEYLKN